MGIFDSLYDASTSGGSLIDRLMAQLGGQPQQQMGPQQSDQAQYSPIAPAPLYTPQQAAQPSPFDNAQWPYGPNGAPSQANAQIVPQQPPQIIQAQPAPAAQPFMQPQNSPGGFGAALRGTMANAQLGPLGWIGGGIAGAMGMGQGTPQEQQQRTVQQTYAALIQAGVPDQQARLAAINPEYGKTIVAQALGPQTVQSLGEGYVYNPKSGKTERAYTPDTKDNFVTVQTGEDGLGKKTFSKMNKATGEMTPIAAPAGADNASGGLGNMELTGKEYLASIPVAQRGTVQGMVDGTIAPPSSFALSKPYWQNMIAAAKNLDPSFDATNWSGRVAGVRDFSAGKSAEMVRSANQTLHHTGALLDSMDALNNGDYPLKNKIGNAMAEATGSGAQGSFRTNAHAVATELSKVFKGANLSDAEVHAWEANLHENMSPEQQRAQIAKMGELLKGSLDALEEKRLASIGPMAAEKQGPLIKAEGQRVLERIDAWIKKGTGAAQGATPGQTKTGVSWSVVQ